MKYECRKQNWCQKQTTSLSQGIAMPINPIGNQAVLIVIHVTINGAVNNGGVY
jgi:hypothetical protein